MAQVKICTDERVRDFIDKPKSVILMDEVWMGKKKRKAEVDAEPTREVPFGWNDATDLIYITPRDRNYKSSSGGGVRGPTNEITSVCKDRNLANLFLFFFTDKMLESMATEMNEYGNKEWVRPVSKDEYYNGCSQARRNQVNNVSTDDDYGEDEDSDEDSEYDPNDYVEDDNSCGYESDDTMDAYYEAEKKEKKRLIPCDESHPAARKRFRETSKRKWHNVTPAMLLVFFGICIIIIGAVGMRTYRIAWMEEMGINYAFVQNAMNLNAFEQCKRHLHFVSNKTLVKKGHKDWHPLQKIKSFLDDVLTQFRKGYNLGRDVSTDESMILYRGQQILFKQYMPAKPIKHGMKVFGMSDAAKGYHYAYFVYTGKENCSASPVDVIKKLLDQDPELVHNSTGRVMYMDNYYTSEEVMRMLYNDYGIYTVGTVSLTKKKSRTDDDFAFHKLSTGAKRKVGRGWMRWATKPIKDAAGHLLYYCQNTTWMDRKQVGIMHNHLVCPPGDCTTLRFDSTARKRVPIQSHPVVPDYVLNMKGVDKTDRSIADYNVTFRSTKYYLAIFWFAFSSLLSNGRVITEEIVEQVEIAQEAKYEMALRRYAREKDKYAREKTAAAKKKEKWEGKPPKAPQKPEKDPWADYVHSTRGWFVWMVDLGHALIKKGILLEWDPSDVNSKRPTWMRQQRFKPCGCEKKCFFCEYNLTGPNGPPLKFTTVTPAKRRDIGGGCPHIYFLITLIKLFSSHTYHHRK